MKKRWEFISPCLDCPVNSQLGGILNSEATGSSNDFFLHHERISELAAKTYCVVYNSVACKCGQIRSVLADHCPVRQLLWPGAGSCLILLLWASQLRMVHASSSSAAEKLYLVCLPIQQIHGMAGSSENSGRYMPFIRAGTVGCRVFLNRSEVLWIALEV